MYEVGIALTSRQPEEVLLIRDDHDSFLFDINTILQNNISFFDAAKAKATLVELMVDRLNSVS